MDLLAERRALALARGWTTAQRLRAGLLVALLGAWALHAASDDALDALAATARLGASVEDDLLRQTGRVAHTSGHAPLVNVTPLPAPGAWPAASVEPLLVQATESRREQVRRARGRLLGAGLGLGLGLLGLQVYLARRTRRLLQAPLLAATVLVGVLVVPLVRQLDEASAQLGAARAEASAIARGPSFRAALPPSLDRAVRPSLVPLGGALVAALAALGLWLRWREYEQVE